LATSAIAAVTTGFIAAGGVAAAGAGAALLAGGAVAGVAALSGTAGAIAALGGPVGVVAAGLLIIGAAIFGSSRPKFKDYREKITFVIKDLDPNGRTEDKTFEGLVHSYD
jgi:hypothetical protein